MRNMPEVWLECMSLIMLDHCHLLFPPCWQLLYFESDRSFSLIRAYWEIGWEVVILIFIGLLLHTAHIWMNCTLDALALLFLKVYRTFQCELVMNYSPGNVLSFNILFLRNILEQSSQTYIAGGHCWHCHLTEGPVRCSSVTVCCCTGR